MITALAFVAVFAQSLLVEAIPALPGLEHEFLSGIQEPSAGAVRANSKGLEFVFVPAGQFWMGPPNPGPESRENPARKVYVDAFWIGKNDVTVAQFYDYCQAVGYKIDWDGRRPPWGWESDNRPMINVTWDEARAYCKWAGGELPTEAQWEKAARGPNAQKYPWGNNWDASKCWTGSRPAPAPAGSYPNGASPYGCLDMAGNVYQWCLDWFSKVINRQDITNPAGPASGVGHVIRGFSFANPLLENPINTRRTGLEAPPYSIAVGFRCVTVKL